MLICLTKDVIKHLAQKVLHLFFAVLCASKAKQIPHPACHTDCTRCPGRNYAAFLRLSLEELLILWRWKGKFSCLHDQMRNPLSRKKKNHF